MTFHFRPAAESDEPRRLLLGTAGLSGSGKTVTALRLATGIVAAQGGRIGFIDTENGRALEYRDDFDFDHGVLEAPFNPTRYAEAIKAGDKAGYTVIIVDSMSHEHEGPGGVLEMHEDALNRMAGDDRAKRERMNMRAWIEPKRERTHLIQGTLIRTASHVICCFRAKPKIKMVKQDGKSVPVDAGILPICGAEFEYEFTVRAVMDIERPGVVDWSAPWSRINAMNDRLLRCFPKDQQITEDTGRALAEWAAGGHAAKAAAKAPDQPDDYEALMKAGWEAAYEGSEPLRKWWKSLRPAQQRAVADWKADFKAKAAEVDKEETP